MLPFGQTFEIPDIAVIGLLVVLEGVLSIDNALVLGLLAKRLPPNQRGRALTYGLVGAFVFRFVSIFTAQLLLKWTIVKLLGGGYLLYVALKHFLFEGKSEEAETKLAIGPDGHPIFDDDSELAESGSNAASGTMAKSSGKSGEKVRAAPPTPPFGRPFSSSRRPISRSPSTRFSRRSRWSVPIRINRDLIPNCGWS